EQAYAEGFEDMQRRVPDISKIQAMTGYRPSMDLTEILEQIVVYQRR
ncbi:nucleoside-diphosphate sugar epimerase, partial [Candidatus Parcubacteria bacterium]